MRKKTNKFSCLILLIVLIIFIIGVIRSFLPGDPELVQVIRVVDGDTFVARQYDGTEIRVRLIGVDAPETRSTGNREEEFYGDESKEFLSDLIENRRVRLEFDVDKYDRFDRVLAYVYLRDNTFVNAELVEGGFAQVATFPPNDKYSAKFLSLQRRARSENRGLWR